MASDEIYISMIMDATQANRAVDNLQERIDQQARDWQTQRQQILAEVRDVSTAINILFGSFRTVISIIGGAIDPVYSALMSIVSSAVGLMLSTAAAMSTTGWLAPAAVVLAAAALGLQAGKAIELEMEHETLKNLFRDMQERVAGIGETARLGGTSF